MIHVRMFEFSSLQQKWRFLTKLFLTCPDGTDNWSIHKNASILSSVSYGSFSFCLAYSSDMGTMAAAGFSNFRLFSGGAHTWALESPKWDPA
jgi:hypothetical protein